MSENDRDCDSSVSDDFGALILEDEERTRPEEVEALLVKGIESGSETEFTRQDWQDIRTEASRQFAERNDR